MRKLGKSDLDAITIARVRTRTFAFACMGWEVERGAGGEGDANTKSALAFAFVRERARGGLDVEQGSCKQGGANANVGVHAPATLGRVVQVGAQATMAGATMIE